MSHLSIPTILAIEEMKPDWHDPRESGRHGVQVLDKSTEGRRCRVRGSGPSAPCHPSATERWAARQAFGRCPSPTAVGNKAGLFIPPETGAPRATACGELRAA
jgi:hypothetical protein